MQKLTRQEMKNVTGGMQWTGCGSNNVIDCRRNAMGGFNLYVPGKPFGMNCPNDGPSYQERLNTCMGWPTAAEAGLQPVAEEPIAVDTP